LNPLRSGLRAFGAWRSVGLAANLTHDYHAVASLLRPSRPPPPFVARCAKGGGGLRPERMGEERSAKGGRNGLVDHFERRTPRA